MPLLLGVTKDETKKSQPCTNFTILPKVELTLLIKKLKSGWWPIVAFCYILDTCRINAGTVFALNSNKSPKEINSFDFGWSLAIKLITPFIQQRSLVGLKLTIKER